MLALDEKTTSYWKEQGLQFFAVGSDALFLAKSCRDSVELWKRLTG